MLFNIAISIYPVNNRLHIVLINFYKSGMIRMVILKLYDTDIIKRSLLLLLRTSSIVTHKHTHIYSETPI